MGLRVYAIGPIAEHGNRNLPACTDARVTADRSTGFGQPGWQWGITFENAADLLTKLRTEEVPAFARIGGRAHAGRGDIERLGIQVHGAPGSLSMDGVPDREGNPPALRADNFARFQSTLSGIGEFLANDSVVLLVGCIAGNGDDGTRLLEVLSGPRCWFRSRVVAFQRTGLVDQQLRTHLLHESCLNPGMRITPWAEGTIGAENRDYNGANMWDWADERSQFAKIGQAGTVTNNMVRDDPMSAVSLERIMPDLFLASSTYRDGQIPPNLLTNWLTARMSAEVPPGLTQQEFLQREYRRMVLQQNAPQQSTPGLADDTLPHQGASTASGRSALHAATADA
jgi:hypothetical protein